MNIERRKGAKRIRFERPLVAKYMSIDGTFCGFCKVIDISGSGAQLEFNTVATPTEFFLMLTEPLKPVFRRCRRVWVRDVRMGVACSSRS